MIRKAILVLMIGFLGWTNGLLGEAPADRDRQIYSVSLIKVIASPNDFDGEHIRVIGYLGFNGIDKSVGLYVSEVDGRNFVISNSVDLRVLDSKIQGMLGKYIIVSGAYHAPSPRASYNGYIDQILDLRLWNAGGASK